MSRKRQKRVVEDPALKDHNAIGDTKRPRYDLRYGQVRECCSLPQYDKQPCQHQYHLRPFDHRKPLNTKLSMHNLPDIAARGGGKVCAGRKISKLNGVSIQRNAHSYSINGHVARCSNSSTASGRQRTLQALKKVPTSTAGKRGGNHQLKEEVS